MGKLVEDPQFYREENLKLVDEEVQVERIEKELSECKFVFT